MVSAVALQRRDRFPPPLPINQQLMEQTTFRVGDKVARKNDGWRVGTIVAIGQEKGIALVLWKRKHSRVRLDSLKLAKAKEVTQP